MGHHESLRPRLLFANSSKLMRQAAEKILGDQFDVVVAGSAEQAWLILLGDPLIQVVFSDLVEADRSDDLNLLRRMRSSESNRVSDTPLILITAGDDNEARRELALTEGATDFIDKPFRPSELRARARAHTTTAVATQRLRLLQNRHNKDAETGLGNRRYFFERLGQALSFARRQHQPLSLVHVHLDGLGAALEGHERQLRGPCMTGIGRLLADAVRQEDTVYRTGPETFSFILPGTSEEGAEAVRCRMAPELDAMGMLNGEGALKVTWRFVVEALDIADTAPIEECLRVVRTGLGVRLAPTKRPATGGQDAAGANLEEALELVAQGDADQVRAHLPDLMERLGPLLRLAEQNDHPAREHNDPSRPDHKRRSGD